MWGHTRKKTDVRKQRKSGKQLLTVNSVNSKNNKIMAKDEMKYEQAVRELEQIVERMENDELDIDQLSEQLKRAKTLVKLCKDKLTKTDEEIKKLLSED